MKFVDKKDFFSDDIWSRTLNPEIQDELLSINEKEFFQLIVDNDVFKQQQQVKRNVPHLTRFIKQSCHYTLPNLGVCSALEDISGNSLKSVVTSFHDPKFLISNKKNHEVEKMSEIISHVANQCDIKMVIDLGSGKGYLSSYLALNFGLIVLGIDASSSNTTLACGRNFRLYELLKKQQQKQSVSGTICVHDFNLVSGEKEKIHFCGKENISNCCPSKNIPNSSSELLINAEGFGRFVPITASIKTDTVLEDLISQAKHEIEHQLPTENPLVNIIDTDPILLCGLHTCGNLAAAELKLFSRSQQIKVLLNISCCYHLLEEEFWKNTFDKEGDKDPMDVGFPLSSVLRQKKFSLSRNARMLACQAFERISQKGEIPTKSQFYRAVLQVIIRDKCGTSRSDYRVGRLMAKCNGFVDYVRQSLKKLKLTHLQITDEEILNYLKQYEPEEDKVRAFLQLRLCLAPCIEALILLDRLMFLYEMTSVEKAHLVQLFNPLTSPRCYALVAFKNAA
ncbi:methyltransferase-like protein 25 isoform X2 [Limulus polyphemus]|uniref:Methyltransferase-like protein 25 isoform X2 n=1 Tax=Limulus polyphemus TaxID=6850 RepID=A0ABM1TK17_LIMPO|nr:methyltransferase-like protein 25 isoform X2 [Limulus polyphemus]